MTGPSKSTSDVIQARVAVRYAQDPGGVSFHCSSSFLRGGHVQPQRPGAGLPRLTRGEMLLFQIEFVEPIPVFVQKTGNAMNEIRLFFPESLLNVSYLYRGYSR
jgi:hypothetical protein